MKLNVSLNQGNIMKPKLEPDHWILIALLLIVIYDMTLLAVYVLVEGHDLDHINSHKELIMFIIGVVSGYLGHKQIDNKNNEKP